MSPEERSVVNTVINAMGALLHNRLATDHLRLPNKELIDLCREHQVRIEIEAATGDILVDVTRREIRPPSIEERIVFGGNGDTHKQLEEDRRVEEELWRKRRA